MPSSPSSRAAILTWSARRGWRTPRSRASNGSATRPASVRPSTAMDRRACWTASTAPCRPCPARLNCSAAGRGSVSIVKISSRWWRSSKKKSPSCAPRWRRAAPRRACAMKSAISCWCAATSRAMPRSIRKPRCAKPMIVSTDVSAASKHGWRRKGARRRCKGMTALAEQSKRDTLSRNPSGGTDASLMSRRHALIRAEKRHAYACAQAQRLPQAIALYQKICARDPADAEAWFMLGTLRGRSGDHAGAEAALRQALAVFPEFAQACLNLGHALEVHGNGAEAEAYYLRAVDLKPDLAEAHEALGWLCQQRGEWPAAEEHYQVALRLHPAATGAALALAALLTRRGRLSDALAALEQAWHHDHTHGELACALARVCLDLDRCEDALHFVQQARRHQPDLVAAHTLEVEILLRRGARAEAEVLLAPLLPRYREHPAIALAHGALSVGSAHACGAVARLEGVLAETALA